MDILPSENYKFDNFIKDSHELALINAARELEKLDDHLWAKMPKNLYKIIRKDTRTIVTSFGALSFRRRYVFNTLTKKYCYPLDIKMQIPRYKRLSNELRVKILELATEVTYRVVGEVAVQGTCLSKSTVFRCVKNSQISIDVMKPFDNIGHIHVQIDEKFMSKTDSKNKTKHYTATVFDNREYISKNRYKLIHRQLISSENLDDLKKRIKRVLISKFNVKPWTSIYVSGDLARYIQCFPDSATYCNAIYVPDKFHCCKFLSDELGLINLCKPQNVVDYLDEIITNKSLNFVSENFKKVYKLYRRNHHTFDPWFNKDYLGCSQEGMNSHYYAPRFGSRANRFNPKTIDKLCHIKEAILNGWKVEIKNPDYRVYKIRINEVKNINYIPSYELPPSSTHTAGKFHEELDKWLNPLIIY